MNILNFDRTEFNAILDQTDIHGFNIGEEIKASFDSLLFLGKNALSQNDENLRDCAIFNIRLCYTYYEKVEDYRKLSELVALVKSCDQTSTFVVDNEVIDKIAVNLN